MPPSTMNSSNSGQTLRKRRYCSSVQKPMTCSTPARLYQLRSKITISPAVGRCATYRCRYNCPFSRSDGAGSATTRNTRGLTRSVMALIVPPLPAASRPSKTTTTRSPLSFPQSCSAHSSTCRARSLFSYSFRLSGSAAVVIGVGLLGNLDAEDLLAPQLPGAVLLMEDQQRVDRVVGEAGARLAGGLHLGAGDGKLVVVPHVDEVDQLRLGAEVLHLLRHRLLGRRVVRRAAVDRAH